jgi:hypothetical protein
MGVNLLPTYRQQQVKPIKPLQPMAPLRKLGPPSMGQRTLPIPGAPRIPANPLLDMMRKRFANRK